MAKRIMNKWRGYTVADCDCKYCLYYDGTDESTENSKWGYSLNRIKQYIERGYVEINYKRYYFNEDKTEFRVRAIW